jgi:hypothetical protein
MELQLKKGRILFRTPSSSEKEGIYGHYYSIKKVAKLYTKSNRNLDKIYKFKVLKPLKLLDFSKKESFEFLDSKLEGKLHEAFQTFTGYGIKELHIYETNTNDTLCVYKNKPKHEIKLCPYTPALKQDEFGNKTLSKALCSMGYDGYYMPEIYLDARDSQEEYLYHKEFFICNPDNLENISQI